MEEQLKAYLDEIKSDIRAIAERMDASEQRIMDRVGGRIDAAEVRIKEFVREADHDLETKVSAEFHKWGRTSDMRTRQALTDTGLLGEKLLALEDRITALERAGAS